MMFGRLWNKIRELRGLRAEMLSMNASLQRNLSTLSQLVNDYKSSNDVEHNLVDDFHLWKTLNPVPAEPLVTICVATWDRPELLVGRCLRSLLNQTYPKLEIIVVGDASPISTVEAMSQIRDPRVKFVNLPERGKYPSVPDLRWLVAGTAPANHALSMATGDYITHLDDDDEHLPDRVERLVGHAKRTHADVVWHPFWICRPGKEPTLVEAEQFEYGHVTTGSVFYRSWLKQIPYSLDAAGLREPGDWNRFRKFRYLRATIERCPVPLMNHYRR